MLTTTTLTAFRRCHSSYLLSTALTPFISFRFTSWFEAQEHGPWVYCAVGNVSSYLFSFPVPLFKMTKLLRIIFLFFSPSFSAASLHRLVCWIKCVPVLSFKETRPTVNYAKNWLDQLFLLSGLEKENGFILVVFTKGQSTTIFMCIKPFSAWWQPNDNRVNLVQACSWPV